MLPTVRDGHPGLEKIPQTETRAARSDHARVCLATLKLSMPALVDGPDDRVSAAYAGWPDRIVIIGVDGHVASPGAPGPWGFKPAEVEVWLRKNVK